MKKTKTSARFIASLDYFDNGNKRKNKAFRELLKQCRSVSNLMRTLREMNGLTQVEMGLLLNLHKSSISRIEAGKYKRTLVFIPILKRLFDTNSFQWIKKHKSKNLKKIFN